MSPVRFVGRHAALVNLLHRHGVEMIPTLASLAPDGNKPRLFQHAKMLDDSEAGGGEQVRQLASCAWLNAQQVKDLAPRRIADSRESGSQLARILHLTTESLIIREASS